MQLDCNHEKLNWGCNVHIYWDFDAQHIETTNSFVTVPASANPRNDKHPAG